MPSLRISASHLDTKECDAGEHKGERRGAQKDAGEVWCGWGAACQGAGAGEAGLSVWADSHLDKGLWASKHTRVRIIARTGPRTGEEGEGRGDR